MSKLTIADADNWQGFYVDGKIVAQQHDFYAEDIVQIVLDYAVTEVERKEVDPEWMDGEGHLPADMSEVKFWGE